MTDTVKNAAPQREDARADETTFAAQDAPLDDQSMAAIRAMMEDNAEAPAPAAPQAKTAESPASAPVAAAAAAPVAKRNRLPPISVALDPAPQSKRAAKGPRPPGMVSRMMAPALTRIKGYRPTPKHLTLAALGLLVFFRPWLVLGIFLLSLLVFIGVFLILGYDGFWQRGMAAARWFAERNPDRAAQMHARLDRFAMKWDAVLDKFPDGTVDGLYLPDFQEIAAAEKRHEEVLDRRLKDLHESKA